MIFFLILNLKELLFAGTNQLKQRTSLQLSQQITLFSVTIIYECGTLIIRAFLRILKAKSFGLNSLKDHSR